MLAGGGGESPHDGLEGLEGQSGSVAAARQQLGVGRDTVVLLLAL